MIIMLSIISELFIDRLFMSIGAYFVLVLSIYFFRSDYSSKNRKFILKSLSSF